MKLDKVIKDLEGMKKAGFISCNIQGFLNQLEKVTESVVVDKFIADWYEEHKGDLEFNIWDWIAFRDEPKKSKNKEFNDWLNKGVNDPIQTLVKMHLFGYEVKKEKKYIVKLKGVSPSTKVLKHNLNKDTWYMGSEDEFYELTPCHTKEELEKAGFGWVFNSPGVEVTEVEE